MISLAEALRERARFLNQHPNSREYGWGDDKNVISALYEFADVVDSWSGEYLSKELTYEENQSRRWGRISPISQMTMEERIAAVRHKKVDFNMS